ncbi:hypothetical protein [Confluentibacter sediminis]|uniref:hypothetical protein n=1 Tax=Confluentibacter sediminis TaxID=2219045 RepID=UPI000DAC598A|nr:hypothetical protein [Confluentibacter sediminis]
MLGNSREDNEYLIESKLSFQNGANTAFDLCNRSVKINMSITNSNGQRIIESPILTFRKIRFVDNLNREYEIEFVKKSDYYYKEVAEKILKTNPNFDIQVLKYYLEGVLICKSF